MRFLRQPLIAAIIVSHPSTRHERASEEVSREYTHFSSPPKIKSLHHIRNYGAQRVAFVRRAESFSAVIACPNLDHD